MERLKSDACTLAAALATVAIGALLFLTLMMPFVFPLVAVVAAVVVWWLEKRASRAMAPARGPACAAANAPVRSYAGRAA